MAKLFLGDCLEVLKTFDDNSIDSIVTDPPAGISFMGKAWDHDKGGRDNWIAWMKEIAEECLRVLKPGGHAFVWSLPRTSHWTATAWEDAGFEPRDRIAHVFGSGFPKSHNLKGDYAGFGTALKPAVEDYWLFRKPLSESTVAKNVLKWGTGALNIDGCRIGTDVRKSALKDTTAWHGNQWGANHQTTIGNHDVTGRWPSHLIHDGSDEVMELFPQSNGQQGDLKGHNKIRKSPNGIFGEMAPAKDHLKRNDSGSAARFFYCAKPSKRERDEGLEGMPLAKPHPAGNGWGETTMWNGENGDAEWRAKNPNLPRRNHHPTVKPLALMRYLIKLITPPGGIALDPFMGSGTTGKAAKELGFGFIGIENEQEYFEIAERRIGR